MDRFTCSDTPSVAARSSCAGERTRETALLTKLCFTPASHAIASGIEKSFALNIFLKPREHFIAHAPIAEKIVRGEIDGRRVKNVFTALKINFFLDKKKLI